MTSHDVRDVLNLPSDHSAGPRPAKKQKTTVSRPNLKGLAREVQNLGGDNPIAIVPEVSIFKKRRVISRKPAAKWELRAFTNSARNDNGALILRHWRRKEDEPNGVDPDTPMQDGESKSGLNGTDGDKKTGETVEDSAFAKYNVRVNVPQYNEDQYRNSLQNSDWTKEETDYLVNLAGEFDLRWTVIWDRYDYQPSMPEVEVPADNNALIPAAPKPSRTMEDLKARYYEVAAKMMAIQKPPQYMTRTEFELYETMQNFNPAQELARKQFAINTMARSKDEAREEESLLLEVKRILARTERFNEERRELYNRLDYPATDSDIGPFKTSQGLQQLLHQLMNVDKSKKRKSIMNAGAENSAGGQGERAPQSAVSETAPNVPNSRRESVATDLPDEPRPSGGGGGGRSRGGHGHAHRESMSSVPATPAEPTPTSATAPPANKKKGAQAPERKKLTEQEEQIYGVTHHDRLGSGPTFRYEKINKLYSHKSGQQQLRITNLLGELDIPARLAMPTAAVTAQFEVLWSAVTQLVDLRKVGEKLNAEIKVEEAKKAERDKARAEAAAAAGGGDEKESEGKAEKKKDDAAEKEGAAEREKAGGAKPAAEAEATTAASASKEAEAESQAKPADQSSEGKKEGEADGDGAGSDGKKAEAADPSRSSAAPEDASAAAGSPTKIKEEQTGDKDKLGGSSRPGSSGAHKRSASVLSGTSDKSAKRQKK